MKNFFRNLIGTDSIDTKHIGVLDGIRAMAVMTVCLFHFWQQSWLGEHWSADALQFIGIENVSIDWIKRTGYEWVDMMILLTGLCLFLPYANMMADELSHKKTLPKPSEFYVKRIARIVPSYYLFLILQLIFFVDISVYGGLGGFFKDLFSHLSFTQTLWYETYFRSQFNGVVWTLSIEAAFYVLFPLIAWLFYKKPFLTFTGMCLCSQIYYTLVIRKHVNDRLEFYFNRFPSFLCVFACGMMTALIICYLAKNMRQSRITGAAFTVLSTGAFYLICLTLKYDLARAERNQLWQVQNRFAMALLFSIFIVGTVFSFNFIRRIFSNRAAKFLASISFNMYLWHQFISVKMKEWKIPYWEAPDASPQKLGDKVWQWKYTLVIWAVSLVVAILITYLFEKPLHKLIMKGYNKLSKGRDKNEKITVGK